MVPTINVQDAVVAIKPKSNLKKGDIITFSSNDARYTGLTVTHRILDTINSEGNYKYQTKGDNNTTADDTYVPSNNIFGKVIFVIPWLGYLRCFLTKTYGWMLLVVLPCLSIIIYDILKLSNSVKNSKSVNNIKFKDIEIKNDDVKEDIPVKSIDKKEEDELELL